MASSLIWYTYPHILFLFFCKYKKQEIKQEKKGGTDLRMQWPAGRTGQALNQTSISSAFAHTTHTHVGPKQCGATAHGLLLHSIRVYPSRSIPSTQQECVWPIFGHQNVINLKFVRARRACRTHKNKQLVKIPQFRLLRFLGLSRELLFGGYRICTVYIVYNIYISAGRWSRFQFFFCFVHISIVFSFITACPPFSAISSHE